MAITSGVKMMRKTNVQPSTKCSAFSTPIRWWVTALHIRITVRLITRYVAIENSFPFLRWNFLSNVGRRRGICYWDGGCVTYLHIISLINYTYVQQLQAVNFFFLRYFKQPSFISCTYVPPFNGFCKRTEPVFFSVVVLFKFNISQIKTTCLY